MSLKEFKIVIERWDTEFHLGLGGLESNTKEIKNGFHTKMYGLPVLPAFIWLSQELGVPLKNITVGHDQETDWCETCGPCGCDWYVEVDTRKEV